jgi:hypothetical protein
VDVYLVGEMIVNEISDMEDEEVTMAITGIAVTVVDDPMITDDMEDNEADALQHPAHPVPQALAHQIPIPHSDLSQNTTISKINNFPQQKSR